jgi:hypothetical protein
MAMLDLRRQTAAGRQARPAEQGAAAAGPVVVSKAAASALPLLRGTDTELQPTARPELSIVIPLLNERENLPLLHGALLEALEPTGRSFELVYVDDGSTDGTFGVMERLAGADRRVVAVRMRRNYGQTPATSAGIDAAEGRVIITMDGDLQNDPADIPLLMDTMAAGFDVVVGWRMKRQDRLLNRKLPSVIANRLIARVTGIRSRDNGCSLKAFRAELIKAIPLYSDMHRFLPAMCSLAGARIAEVPVRHHARRFGQSKYGLSRIYKVVVDLLWIKTVLTLYERRMTPMLGAASVTGAVGLAMTVYGLMENMLNDGTMIWPTVGLTLLFLALHLVMLGLLGQILYRDGEVRLDRLAALTARGAAGPALSDTHHSHRSALPQGEAMVAEAS